MIKENFNLIKQKIEQTAQQYKTTDLISSSKKISEVYLNNSSNGERLITSKIDVISYAIMRMPATYEALSFALEKMMENNDIEKISGTYKHFKGKYYCVYCSARDKQGNKYVLYQQNYDDKSFWIRPYKMFFEKVSVIDTTSKKTAAVSRFFSGKIRKCREVLQEVN